jgi:hypothetical protein
MLMEILHLFYLENQIPQSYQVMFCEKNTKIQDVEIFMLRALLNPFENVQAFVLANFQNLSLNVQLEAYKLYNHYKSSQPSKLYIFFYKPNGRDDQIIDAISNANPMPNEITYTDLQTKLLPFYYKRASSRFIVVRAERTGLGKSRTIRDDFLKDKRYVRIPISGDANRSKLATKHENEMWSIIKEEVSKQSVKQEVGIHYDIYHTVNGTDATHMKESLNVILFDILILRSINRNAGCLFHFNQFDREDRKYTFFLEVSEQVNTVLNTSNSLFMQFFPHLKIQWKDLKEFKDPYKFELDYEKHSQTMYINHSKIRVAMAIESDMQLVCRYLEVRAKGP